MVSLSLQITVLSSEILSYTLYFKNICDVLRQMFLKYRVQDKVSEESTIICRDKE